MVDGKQQRIGRFPNYQLPSSIALTLLIGCGGTPSPEISLVGSPTPAAIEVRGLPARDIAALSSTSLTSGQWQQILHVSVAQAATPMTGRYTAADGVIRFTPMYGFDPGRSFSVRFDATKIPGVEASESWRKPRVSEVRPRGARAERATVVRQVYPSGAELPENMLRFYIEFSAPMGRAPALEHVRLVDEDGMHVMDPFLPVEAGFWTPDRTRFTLFFDPGRVKRGIKPNRDLGRALKPGKRYALVIGERWMDSRGQPLKSEYRHEFTVTRAIEKPLDPAAWKIDVPRVRTRDPLVVTFPWALDYGLLQRAFDILGSAEISGEIAIDQAERRWAFTPRNPWTPGEYSLLALTVLEDPAGNRLGRAFEVMGPQTDKRPSIEIPFAVR